MRVALEDRDGNVRIVSAICVEYDSNAQVCRVVLMPNLLYYVNCVSQSRYNEFFGELFVDGFASLVGYECTTSIK